MPGKTVSNKLILDETHRILLELYMTRKGRESGRHNYTPAIADESDMDD